MTSMKERYEEYCREHLAEINQELEAAGLPLIKQNYLAFMLSGKPWPLSFEEYAECVVQAMEKASRVGFYHIKRQSEKAKKPRSKIGDEKKPMGNVVGKLALANEHREDSAKELWIRFFGELAYLGLDPKETPHESGDFNKSAYEYDYNDGRKKMTFGQFAKVVSAFRTEKKLP